MFMAGLHNRCLYTEGQRKEVNLSDFYIYQTCVGSEGSFNEHWRLFS